MTRYAPAIIVHGGAGTVRDDRLPRHLEGCKEAALVGWKILEQAGTALDAVEAAVVALEDNPLFNAGTGSTLNSRGEIEMDAAITEGSSHRAGAVAAVQKIKNPIKLARRVMEDGRHVLLASEGALLFARQIGFPECAPEDLVVEERRKHWQERHGTVGAVALDAAGVIAVATSTGGILGKLPGRVGDSPLFGCGTYADDYGGVSCTGDGEAIIGSVLAKTAVTFLEKGTEAQVAAKMAVTVLEEMATGRGGLILIDRWGKIGYARNTSHMPVCYITDAANLMTDS